MRSVLFAVCCLPLSLLAQPEAPQPQHADVAQMKSAGAVSREAGANPNSHRLHSFSANACTQA
jgi:hypothetical protein